MSSEGTSQQAPQRKKRSSKRRARPESEQLSRTLSKVLRHDARKLGLAMSPDGYVLLSELLALKAFKGTTEEQIAAVVEGNDKQRFSLIQSEQGPRIRANQGHTITGLDHELLLTRIERYVS